MPVNPSSSHAIDKVAAENKTLQHTVDNLKRVSADLENVTTVSQAL